MDAVAIRAELAPFLEQPVIGPLGDPDATRGIDVEVGRVDHRWFESEKLHLESISDLHLLELAQRIVATGTGCVGPGGQDER